MPRRVEIRLNFSSFHKLRDALASKSGAVGEAYAECIRLYRVYLWERFNKYSRGGGNWKGLRPGTLRAKLAKGFPRDILVRTRILQSVMKPTASARIIKTGKGIRLIFGGGKRYPNGTSVAVVMDAHDKGGGNLPKRQILVKPTGQVLRNMAIIQERGMQRTLDGN